MWFAFLFIFLCIDLLIAWIASGIAVDKGYSQGTWFIACFLLPGVAYVLLIALPDMKLRKQNEEMIELQKQLLFAITGENYESSSISDLLEPIAECPSEYPFKDHEQFRYPYAEPRKPSPNVEVRNEHRRHFFSDDGSQR